MEFSAIPRNQASIRETATTAVQTSRGYSLDRQRKRCVPDQKKGLSKEIRCHLFFNTVLQYSLENNLVKWQENTKGIWLSDKTEDCLTNLRFADDVLLFSTSLEKLRDMLCAIKASSEAMGLGIHPTKQNYSQPGQRERKGNLIGQRQD